MSADVSTPLSDLRSFQYPEAAQKMLNLWVGASSVFWAPFWAASSAGLGYWMFREGAARAAPPTDDLPPAFRNWMTARSLWFTNAAPVAEAVEEATEAAIDIITDVPEAVLKAVEPVHHEAQAVAETVAETASQTVPEVVEAAAAEWAEVADTIAEALTVEDTPAIEAPVPPVIEEVLDVVPPPLKPTKEAATLAVSKIALETVSAPRTAKKKSAKAPPKA